MAIPERHALDVGVRLIVKVLQDEPRTHETYADLAESLKCRLARLKIPYDAAKISDAIEQLERGGTVHLVDLKLPKHMSRDEPPPAGSDISRAEAAAILRGLTGLIRTVPTAPPSRIDIYAPVIDDTDWGDHDRY